MKEKKFNFLPSKNITKITLVNFLYTFALTILTLSMVAYFSKSKLSMSQLIGCCILVTIIFVLCISIALVSYIKFNCYYLSATSNILNKTNIVLSLICPLYFIYLQFAKKHYDRVFKVTHPNVKNNKKEPLSTIAVLLYCFLVVVLICWIKYVVTSSTNTPGVLDIFYYTGVGFSNGSEIIFYLLVISAFMFFVNKSMAIEAGICRLTAKFKNKEIILVPFIMFFFALCGTIYGMGEDAIPLYFILMPFCLSAGFDAITAIMIMVLGTSAGFSSACFTPSIVNLGVESYNSTDPVRFLSTSDGLVFRAVIFVILLALFSTWTVLYALKVKKNPEKSIVYDIRDTFTKKFSFTKEKVPLTKKRIAILWIFFICFLIMILCNIDWGTIFNTDIFEKFNNEIIKVFPFLTSKFNSIGVWSLFTSSAFFIVCTIVIAIIDNDTSISKISEGIIKGMLDMFSVAIVIAMSYGISQMMSDSGLANDVSKELSNIFNSKIPQPVSFLIVFVVLSILSFFIISQSGFTTLIMPNIGPSLAQSGMSPSGLIACIATSNGFASTFGPTGNLIINTSYCDMPFNLYFKKIWPLALITFCVMMLIILTGSLIPLSSGVSIF